MSVELREKIKKLKGLESNSRVIMKASKEANHVVTELEQLGYKKTSGCGTEIWVLRPGSETGNPGITVRSDGKFFSYHTGDQWNDGERYDIIDIIEKELIATLMDV